MKAANPTIETILTRRSIRKYKPDPVPPETMRQIVQTGLFAPSAMGRQPWHVVVVSGTEQIDRITREVKAATARMPENPYRDFVGGGSYTVNYGAPTFTIVSGDMALSPHNAQNDCALLLGTMMLAAHSLGIGSCWINQLNVLNDEPGFREYLTSLGVPAVNHVFGCACFGHADGPVREAAPRRENLVVYIP